MAADSAVCCYDLTIPQEYTNEDLVKSWFKETSKKWCFQLERGTTGYLHYQCRFSLKQKTRMKTLIARCPLVGGHLSITSNANRDNMFYVMKDETRTLGPWTNKDEIAHYIPRQVREIKDNLYPWQQQIINMKEVWDTRSINILYDDIGNLGKSVFGTMLGCCGQGIYIPYMKDFKDVMRMVMERPKHGLYILDLPRAIKKDKMRETYASIEQLKSGYAYDDRYKWQEEYYDCPCVFIFTNTIPDLSFMSKDRWKFWQINERFELVPLVTFADLRLSATKDEDVTFLQ